MPLKSNTYFRRTRPVYSTSITVHCEEIPLWGGFVVELTISPEGQVTAAKVLSSELGDEALEQKLIAKFKRFKFTNADVRETTVAYPIDFLPS